jgi:hypothetical protein
MKKPNLNEQIVRMRTIMGLNESKKTEADAIRILSGVENADTIVKQFAQGDQSKDQKNIGLMAFIYKNFNYTDIRNIVEIMNDYDELVTKKRVKPIQIIKGAITIGDKQFNDFIRFSEYIHGEKNKYGAPKKGSNVDADFIANKKPMWSGNDIDIYEGDEVGKCIAYTMGGLTGRGYSFCIGQPGNTMYQSYRDTKASSFYFIVDKNHFNTNEDGSVNLDDPLHIVVFDNTQHGLELTDANNTTGTIAQYGNDSSKYVEYLKSKGVPVENMINKPKTDQENQEDELLGRQNKSLEWFVKLPIELKSKYIGRGHQLTNEQFDYLIGK